MQGRRWKWSTALVLLGVVACGDDAMELLGDAMVGVGDSMVAVGDAFVDVGDGMARDASSDAAAQPPTVLEAECRVVNRVRRVTRSGETTIETVNELYAAVFSTDFDPRNERMLRAMGCNYRSSSSETCPPDTPTSTCEASGEYLTPMECGFVAYSFDRDSIVVSCGSQNRMTITGPSPSETFSFGYWSTARLIVD